MQGARAQDGYPDALLSADGSRWYSPCGGATVLCVVCCVSKTNGSIFHAPHVRFFFRRRYAVLMG